MSRLAGSREQRLTDEVIRLRAEAAELPPGELRSAVEEIVAIAPRDVPRATGDSFSSRLMDGQTNKIVKVNKRHQPSSPTYFEIISIPAWRQVR